MPKYDPDYFKERFSDLYKEIENREETVEIDGVRTSAEQGKKAAERKKDAGPNVIDFIRLCDTEDEVVEIINYMEEEGKINSQYAKKLRKQLIRKGLSSFGPKREPGEYSFIDKDSE